MGSISNHYGDVATWVEKVINSCESPQQEIAARKLLRQFEKRIETEVPELCYYYSLYLKNILDTKFYTDLNQKFL